MVVGPLLKRSDTSTASFATELGAPKANGAAGRLQAEPPDQVAVALFVPSVFDVSEQVYGRLIVPWAGTVRLVPFGTTHAGPFLMASVTVTPDTAFLPGFVTVITPVTVKLLSVGSLAWWR